MGFVAIFSLKVQGTKGIVKSYRVFVHRFKNGFLLLQCCLTDFDFYACELQISISIKILQ